MKAVVTIGNGGYEKLEYSDVDIPTIEKGDVLLCVLAAGVNNTDINTRVGWYSSDAGVAETDQKETTSSGWNGATRFPLIQGTDCCGRVVKVGEDADSTLLGLRVLVRPCIHPKGFASHQNTIWFGSDFNGAFAQYVKVPATEVFPVDCSWTNEELATIPCSYGTAENMVRRASVRAGDHVLVPGASGGVGSAVVQLVKRRGATVTAITSAGKVEQVKAIGADRVLTRGDDILGIIGEGSIDVVIDNVGGVGFAAMIDLLKRGSGRYITSGAVAGPIVQLDLRKLYLKDLTLLGCTAWDEPVFPSLIRYIEAGEIRPLLAQASVFPLSKIVDAQRAFGEKKYVGKIVLVPVE
eukprot:gnl/Dysnectes_brevis/5296_a7551_646.p1 GENE.gnl/Dysnectes_brevis/5296_a7551_646~~gnl/Dysnectes_brevis/5296_a7551_646.p1  ORF type:complete len:365 (+),score=40.38 gnl/Dysnectes_brevis/5296_a7551_646:41-1096(+)